MARDIPSPCCGSFSVTIKEQAESDAKEGIRFSCCCGQCGLAFGEEADSRAEALYNYDKKCLSDWRRNPNGLQDWMRAKPKGKSDVIRRQAVIDCLNKYFRQ